MIFTKEQHKKEILAGIRMGRYYNVTDTCIKRDLAFNFVVKIIEELYFDNKLSFKPLWID